MELRTPEESKTKQCPLKFIPNGPEVGAMLCVADACMFWQWHYEIDRPPNADPEVIKIGVRKRTDRGYCGHIGYER